MSIPRSSSSRAFPASASGLAAYNAEWLGHPPLDLDNLCVSNGTLRAFRRRGPDYIPVPHPARAHVAGIVWQDRNGNGVQSPGEDGVANTWVAVTADGGRRVLSFDYSDEADAMLVVAASCRRGPSHILKGCFIVTGTERRGPRSRQLAQR